MPPAINSFDVNTIDIDTQISIISINEIDTLNMFVELTIQLNMKWFDQRLNFKNLMINQENLVPLDIAEKLWLPTENIVHENAIIGKIEYGARQISVIPSSAEDMDPGKTEENRIFTGANNPLKIEQRLNIVYNCLFDVEKLLFDKGACNFTTSIKTNVI